jgi:hypothetical protein
VRSAPPRGRRGDDRAFEEAVQLRLRREVRGGRREQRPLEPAERSLEAWQGGQSLAQGYEVSWPGGPQRHAGEHALDVADFPQHRVQPVVAIRADERRDRRVTPTQNGAVAQRPLHPAAQLPRAHGRRRAIDDAEQRRVLAAREARFELEVAAGDRVHDEGLVPRLACQSGQVGQRAFLRVPGVLQERAGRAGGEGQVLAPEAGEVLRAELCRERATRGLGQELPGRALDDPPGRRKPGAFRQQELRRPQSLEFRD